MPSCAPLPLRPRSPPSVRRGCFDFSEVAFIDEERHRRLGGGTLSRNDIVVTIRGTLGNTAIYRNEIPFEVVRINSAMLAWRSDQGAILIPTLSSDTFARPSSWTGSASISEDQRSRI